MTDTDEYRIWTDIKTRCKNKNSWSYHKYGGRGITLCDRWNHFVPFFEDMGKRPSKHHSIDRKDNKLGYTKDNCRWATPIEQARNKTKTRMVTINGVTQCAQAWAEQNKVNYKAMMGRIYLGWPLELAVQAPVISGKCTRREMAAKQLLVT